jgi:hypothetical protein
MIASLVQRICDAVGSITGRYPYAWLVWCDPRRDWLPLLQRAAASPGAGGFALLQIEEQAQGMLGGPAGRRALQEQINRGQPFVLWVPVLADRLGWLWSQALLAERIYDRPLRDQLREWGWRPDRLTITDDELAALARRNLDRDPAEWSGGGLEPDLGLLLDVLAGGATPEPDQRLVLDLTIERAGLPDLTETDLPGWRNRALARLLTTQAFQAAPGVVSDRHELLIPADRRPLALALLDRWLDSLRLNRTLPDAILAADRIAGLAPPSVAPGPEHGPFLSRAAEGAAFAATCTRLARLAGRDLLEGLAALAGDLVRHSAGFWGETCAHPAALPWAELLRLSQAAGEALAASPTREWANPAEAIAWYTGDGWRLDRAGEEILRNLGRATPELLALITPLRAAFRARWEDTLLRWSALWSATGCTRPALATAGDWLSVKLQAGRATAIIMADALRYDLAASLAAAVNAAEGAERASLEAARAPLPSITALGMAAALPIPEHELEAELVAGKWLIRQRGHVENLALAAGRRAWWGSRGGVGVEGLLTLADLQAHEAPPPAPGRTRLVLYDDTIDTLGHDDELEAQGSGIALNRYSALVRRLHDAGWSRILVVTDHGFIQWPGSQETNAPAPALDPAYSSRRALAYPAQVTFAGPQALAPGGQWRVALPSGAACFRTYGGLGFFHGGAALQEWIIPCVTVEWPSQAQPVNVAMEPMAQVLSQRPRVTLLVRRGSLLVEDAIARQVDVVIRDARSRAILFRSPVVAVTPDREQMAVALTAVAGASAPRGTPLQIEVRDGRTEEVLDATDSLLSIELLAW